MGLGPQERRTKVDWLPGWSFQVRWTYGEQELWYWNDILFFRLGRIINAYRVDRFCYVEEFEKLAEHTYLCGSEL